MQKRREDYYGEAKEEIAMGLMGTGMARDSLRTRIGRLEFERGELIDRLLSVEKDILALERLLGERV